jgi:hypothetical protein
MLERHIAKIIIEISLGQILQHHSGKKLRLLIKVHLMVQPKMLNLVLSVEQLGQDLNITKEDMLLITLELNMEMTS